MTDQPSRDGGGSGASAGRAGQLTSAAKSRWATLQERYRWLRHVLAAWKLMQRNNASQYAAAITYFSFLALFPLLLLAVSVVGFVLHAHPAAQASLFAHLADKAPGPFGNILKSALQTAIKNRSAVGVVGLLGVLLTGLGWIGNLRSAIDMAWGRRPKQRNAIMSRVANLLVLGGLGAGLLVSLALTAIGTSLTQQLANALSLESIPGMVYLLKVVGIAIAAGGDMIIFWWLLVRLPEARVSRRTAVLGAIMASVGFEVLKIVGTYTIAKSTSSPTAGPFASVIAILVWIQLVCRYMLFSCAWMATAQVSPRAANRVPIIEPAPMRDRRTADAAAITPARVGAALVGAGALAGALATWKATASGGAGAGAGAGAAAGRALGRASGQRSRGRSGGPSGPDGPRG